MKDSPFCSIFVANIFFTCCFVMLNLCFVHSNWLLGIISLSKVARGQFLCFRRLKILYNDSRCRGNGKNVLALITFCSPLFRISVVIICSVFLLYSCIPTLVNPGCLPLFGVWKIMRHVFHQSLYSVFPQVFANSRPVLLIFRCFDHHKHTN